LLSFKTRLFLNNIIAGIMSHQEIKLPKTRSLTGFHTTNKSKTLISSLAPPNSTINPSTYHSPLTHGNTSTIGQYTSTVLKHLKKKIQILLAVKTTWKTTPLRSTSYYDPQKKQSLPLQINLPAYPEPYNYKKVHFLEFPDHTLQNNRFPCHLYPRENNPHHHHHHGPFYQVPPSPHKLVHPQHLAALQHPRDRD
jgi:hypothetical protein